MLELGDGAEGYHLGLAEPLADCEADIVFACGPNMQKLYETLAPEKRGAWAPDSAALIPYVVDALKAGDVVMVKGSLGSRMAPIVAAIKARFGAA
jgi:UDP-N-acetylmuramoyl-tripeptide--D-alanyl-D-alanine ligase